MQLLLRIVIGYFDKYYTLSTSSQIRASYQMKATIKKMFLPQNKSKKQICYDRICNALVYCLFRGGYIRPNPEDQINKNRRTEKK